MTTIHILGILTALEIIFCNQNFIGNTVWLWVFYGIYKLIISGV